MNLCKQLEDTPTRFGGQPIELFIALWANPVWAGGIILRHLFPERIFFSNLSTIFIQTSASD